jgi:hypothetical protein
MSEHDRRRPETEPQVADGVDEADPETAEGLVRGSWPATDEELEERTGRDRGPVTGADVLHRQVPGGEESAET